MKVEWTKPAPRSAPAQFKNLQFENLQFENLAQLFVAETTDEMIVHHPDRLHERVADG